MREGEARRRAGGERGEVQGKVQSAVERETREGGVGPRPGGPACQSGEDGAHHGALRDRSKTIREVRPTNLPDNIVSRAVFSLSLSSP